MKYAYYLFDFDGTVADTGEGIRKSVAYSAEKLGYEVPDTEVLNRFIGPPLRKTFLEVFGDEAKAEQAVEIYAPLWKKYDESRESK